MDQVITGIKEGELGSLSLEVMGYAERISEIFDRIESAMDRIPACFQGTPSEAINQHYQEIRSNFPVIKDNVTSYSNDLITLINRVHENNKYLSGLFRDYTSDIRGKIKTNNS
ncbi:hypothetical protein IKF92_02070 [Candidatus Saccharibacteria bacterium]|nr:hypothetical protein [Candidatus Saccharibacteria bacterium]